MNVPPPTRQDRELDCRGKACPVPVIELAKAVAQMSVGDTVTLMADDPGANVDIPVWCRMKRQELVSVTEEGTVVSFCVRKTS